MFPKKKLILPLLFLLVYFLVLFHKVYLNHIWPFPGDVLVTFYHPWIDGGWAGYIPGIFHKQAIASDVFRLYFPWKSLGSELIRSGHLPLWNPYNFAGTPFLANLQSSFFYPFGIFFYLLPLFPAWLIYLFSQTIIAFVGMYLYVRQITKSQISAILGGVGFISTGFMLSWFDWGLVGHAAAWFGWIFFVLHKVFRQNDDRYKLLIPIIVACAILSGYPQITALIFIAGFFYALVPIIQSKSIDRFLQLFFWVGLGIIITGVQTIPTLELSLQSARDIGRDVIFSTFTLPFQNLITIFSPDFFGNIAVNNFWGKQNYQESLLYFGTAVIPLVLISITDFKNKLVKFFTGTSLVSLLFALPLPFATLLKFIPIISSGIPMRTLFIFQVAMIVLAAIGLDRVINGEIKLRSVIKVLSLTAGLYLLVWLITLTLPRFGVGEIETSIAKRNVILPTITIFISSVLLIGILKLPDRKKLFGFALIFLMIFEANYFFSKFTPFAPANYFFPKHSFFGALQTLSPINRVWGYKTGDIVANLPTYYRFQTINGYDSLYINRYGQLLSSITTGKLSTNEKRADADFPQVYSQNLVKLARLMGVSYYSFRFNQEDKETDSMWSELFSKLDVVRNDAWPIGKDKLASPRVFLVNEYVMAKSDQEVISKMFGNLDLSKTLVLEENPNIKLSTEIGSAKIIKYEPNEVTIDANSKGNLLFLSDNYYSGWNAYIDKGKQKIYRADFTFRAVFVPKGRHSVVFKYEPLSVKIGIIISVVGIGIYSALIVRSYRQRKRLHR